MPFAIAAGITAGGSLLSGLIGAGASNKAAGQAAQASQQATQLNTNIYNQTRGDLQPWITQGRHALDTIDNGMGWWSSPTDFSNLNLDQSSLENTPGYQFTRDQGLKAVQNSATARGLGVSGAAMKGAANFATGLADNTWQNVFNANLAKDNADMSNKNNYMNRLMGLAGLGENAAVQSGNVGSSTAASGSNALMQGGLAQAGGTTGAASSLAGGINGVGNSAMQYLMMNKLFGGGGSGGGTNADGLAYNAFMNATPGNYLPGG